MWFRLGGGLGWVGSDCGVGNPPFPAMGLPERMGHPVWWMGWL